MKKLIIVFIIIVCFIITGCNNQQTVDNEKEKKEDFVTITFDSNGGNSIDSQIIEKGGKVTKPKDPIKEYYDFDGWYLGEEKWSFIGYVVTENITLTAKWESQYNYIVIDDEIQIRGLNRTDIRDLIIPEYLDNLKVTSIGEGAFSGCSALTNITIPDSVTSIGYGAFSGCSALTKMTLPFVGDKPHTPTDKYQYPFGYIFGTSSYIGGIFTQQYYDEANTSLTQLYTYYIPESLKEVEITGSSCITYGAFRNCTSLKSITIPNSVTSIALYAFQNCTSLTSITIPDSVTSIGKSAFYGCSGLTSIVVDINNSIYDSRENCNAIIENETNVLLVGCSSTKIPDSVTSIGSYAFSDCTGLTNITIPDSVTSIGYGAFSGCSALTKMTLPFVGDKPHTPTDKYQYPFGYIFGTSSYKGGVSTKQYYYGSYTSTQNNTTYYIPQSLKEVVITGSSCITYGAFYNCRGLTSITIPDSVTSIEHRAFFECAGLISITIPNSVTSIGASAFYNCRGLTSITIPNSVTSIEYYAFQNCTSLTSITIPDSITSIGGGAFSDCTGLTNITIPDSVTSIGGKAFYNCHGLTKITIPDSVTSIGVDAFYNCNVLTIYCEASKKPSGWETNWNSSNRPVVWSYKGE